MFKILKKPHPFIFNIYSILIPSFITFLIIAVFAPFQFQEFGIYARMSIAFMISVLVAMGIGISVKSLQRFFPKSMSEDTWTVGKELLLVLFVICFIALFISIAFLLFLPDQNSILSLISQTVSTTVAISILPVLISILFEQYKHQKIQLQKASALTESISNRNAKHLIEPKETISQQQLMIIKSENDDIELQLSPQDLMYIKSDGNYVDVYFQHSNVIQKKVIRNRLKAIEEMLPEDLFFRCHNRFIVNGRHIINIEGNARNLILSLQGISENIPVSRSKAKAISIFLENLP